MKHGDKDLFVKEGRLRSFGRTSSRLTQKDQQKLDDKLKPYLLTAQQAKEFKPQSKLVVEIGMGNGACLAQRAKNEPETQFIGCEVYKNGLNALVNTLAEQNSQNFNICHDDARDLLENLPPQCADELVVLYPDPWPKNKQKKRRIVNAELLNLANRLLKDDGVLFIATDIPDYMMWILREVYNHDTFFPIATKPTEWATAPDWWLSTKYEQKAIKQGRSPWYMTFKRGVDKSNTKCAPLTI
ncbi:MAG: tRNA (guanosine(46)-N7)-methyltransferase TrmB [Pseudomonadota bacterium]|nr:tRNA (guanosine(46)-N7)-methyltransferase TrmB [Pseudomonadota bacterium]